MRLQWGDIGLRVRVIIYYILTISHGHLYILHTLPSAKYMHVILDHTIRAIEIEMDFGRGKTIQNQQAVSAAFTSE